IQAELFLPVGLGIKYLQCGYHKHWKQPNTIWLINPVHVVCPKILINYGTNNQAVFHSGIVSELSIGFLFNMIKDIVCYMGQRIFLSCHNFINVSHNLIRICFRETQSWK
ncbi:MAG: hypothetical protein WAM09_05880, partial [Anaerolineales bacterium]